MKETFVKLLRFFGFLKLPEDGKIEIEELHKDIEYLNSNPFDGFVKGKSYSLSYYAIKKGMSRPAVMIFQMCANKLADKFEKPEWGLVVDGIAGKSFDRVARDIQKYYNLSVDGVVGSNTWKALTPDLGSWKPPLHLRIAECQNTFESGKKGFDYYGMIPAEGWYNFGIWNVNRGSLHTLLKMGGAEDLYKYRDSNPGKIADWMGSKKGVEIQIGPYLAQKIIKPSIENLVSVGFYKEKFGLDDNRLALLTYPEDLSDNIEPYYERLLTLACDITINSGAGGFAPMKTPRDWGGNGIYAWPEKLPHKEVVKKVFSEVFGKPLPNDTTYIIVDNRDYYRKALDTCLWALCENDEQRICFIAELQARCIIDAWRNMVIQRRRCVAWKEGHSFQGTKYCMSEDFGIGV